MKYFIINLLQIYWILLGTEYSYAQETVCNGYECNALQDETAIFILAGVGALMLLIVVAAIIFICVIYKKGRKERLRITHVRAADEWVHTKHTILTQTQQVNTTVTRTEEGCQTDQIRVELRDRQTPQERLTPRAYVTPRLKGEEIIPHRKREPRQPPKVWLPHSKPYRKDLSHMYTITK